MTDVVKVFHKDLYNFISQDKFKYSKYLPISKIRAWSHQHNPRANADDLVLVLVYEEGEMTGYLGVLPDDLYFLNSADIYEKEHVGWLSCMWVNPELRGKGIAKTLIQTVFEAWNYRILVTEFTPAAKGLYDRTAQFLDFSKPEGLRLYLRMNLAYLLPAQNPVKWEKFVPIFSIFDKVFNFFNNIRFLVNKKPEVSFVYLTEPDLDVQNFIEAVRNKNEIARRNTEDLKWIINYPWLQSGVAENEESKRYHFSSVSNHFSFLNIKVLDDNKKLIGFLILSVRDQNMKLPYCYFIPGKEKNIIEVIEYHLVKLKINMLTVFQPALVEYWKKNSGKQFLKRKMNRHYIISKVFENQLLNQKEIIFQDGDADAAFT